MKRWVIAAMAVLLCFVLAGGALAQDVVIPTPSPTPDDDLEIRIDPEEAAEDAVEITQSVAEATAGTLAGFFDQLTEAPRNDIARVVLVLGGAVLLLVGWRVYEFVILIAGALIGATLALSLVPDGNQVLELAALVVGGILGAVLASVLYYVAVFFIGAYIGIILVQAVATSLGFEAVSSLVLLLGAVLGGVAMVAIAVYFLLFLSVIVGAQMVVLGLNLEPIWVLILAVVGLVIQVLAARAVGDDVRRRPRRIRLLRRGD